MNDAVRRMLEKYKMTTWQEHERALREVLQEITLVGLWRAKFFDHAAFYGGTALRILYGLDRFSEDLDFTLLSPNPTFKWADFASLIEEEIGVYDFTVKVEEKQKAKESPIYSAFLKANTLESLIQIGLTENNAFGLHPEKSIRIKVEVDTDPTLGFDVKRVYIREPVPVSVATVSKPDLFASKLHAALFRTWKKRVKGRDWYDVLWFIQQGTPLRLSYFARCMEQINGEKVSSESEVHALIADRLETLDMEAAKQDVAPFLKDRTPIQEWSKEFFLFWIQQIKFDQSV